ncbi:MAG: TlpA disulfide reductase family protein [Planctomycetota bacterium]|nr:TlpA disulfide reductase family protein [Planctomycetota bacterium]
MSSRSLSTFLILLLVTALAAVATSSCLAEETKDKAANPDKAADPEKAEADPFAVPDGDGRVLTGFIRSMFTRARSPKGKTEDEQAADFKKSLQAAADACEKLYEASLKDEATGVNHAATSIQAGTAALKALKFRAGDKNAANRLRKLAETAANDKREPIANLGKQLLLELKFELPIDADEKVANKLADDLKAEFAKGDVSLQTVRFVSQFLPQFERQGYLKAAIDLNNFFAGQFAKSDDAQIASFADRLKGTARRLNLPGNPIELSGKLLDGTELDWASYKGKVVLVDFWATWCGPCIRELPNVVENYEKYHDRGFEVLGISLDTDRAKTEEFVEVRKIPWKSLFSDDAKTNGWKHPMVTHYGIGGIPTVILVNQQGNVVSLNARGPELGRLLAELLPSEDP